MTDRRSGWLMFIKKGINLYQTQLVENSQPRIPFPGPAPARIASAYRTVLSCACDASHRRLAGCACAPIQREWPFCASSFVRAADTLATPRVTGLSKQDGRDA